MKKYKIDFFSDTNTNPSKRMRQAMCQAEVGNEVAGEDPTVNKLLEKVCELLGKEAAVFLPSGMMCNGIAYRVLCKRRGDLIVLDKTAHPLLKGAGLIAGLAQAEPHVINGNRGIFTVNDIEPIISKSKGYNQPAVRVVSIEQSTNFGGGSIWPLKIIEDVCSLAHSNNSYTHMDGARLLNAVAETGISAAEYSKHFDSVWIDFSKCLGAPMGAVLAGSRAFIEEAWYYKFQQGGGLHQAGIIAAGCLYALEHNISKITEIHARTKQLAILLSELSFIKLDIKDIETNIILLKFDHPYLSAFEAQAGLAQKGIRVFAFSDEHIRLLLHLDITLTDINEVFLAFKEIGERSSLTMRAS
ncbi:MAG: threonine aldolase family protein [Alphaproteobacteria bacterium]|nr:threonine aldolase family protein [Alphaproteobacteria bacterium]